VAGAIEIKRLRLAFQPARRPRAVSFLRWLGIPSRHFRRSGTPCWTPGPVRPAIAPQESTEHKRYAE